MDQIRDCRITNKNVTGAIDDLISRANFLLRDVCVTFVFQHPPDSELMEVAEGALSHLSRENSDPPLPLSRQRSNPVAAPAPLFPTPLIRSESQNSVMRRSVSISAGDRDPVMHPNQNHADNWEVGDRRELAELVVKFICDRSLIVDDLRTMTRRVRSLCERHCRSLQLINDLAKILSTCCPKSTLRTNFIRLVLINLQGCRSWMDSGVIRCAAMDEFKQLLQSFMKIYVLPNLRSDKADDKLCAIAALSAPWREEDLTMLVSTGLWDGILSLCKIGKDVAAKESVGGFMYKPRKLAGEARVSVHSASANLDSARSVLDTENSGVYWQSEVSTNPERWITFEISPPQFLQQVILICADDQDRGSGYAPRDVTIEVGASPDSLERIVSASIPQSTNGPHPLIPTGTVASNEPCAFVKFRILECGGRNCRVRGMSFVLKGADETNASLPAVTLIGRAAATSLALTAFPRSEKLSAQCDSKVSDCKRTIVSSFIHALRQSSQHDSSTHSFAMGMIALCVPSAEVQHPDHTLSSLSKDLIQALLILFAKDTTEARTLAQVVGILQSTMKSTSIELCDASALAASAALRIGHSKEEMHDVEAPAGLQFLEVVTDFLHRHMDSPIKFLVARQSLAELMLDLGERTAWKIAVSRFARRQLDILNREHLQGSLSTPKMARAQYALSLLGGYIPILQVGCGAQLDTGELVRVVHYDFGDVRAGVVLLDGSINFVSSSSLEISPLSTSYLNLQDLYALLPLLKMVFSDEFRQTNDGKLNNLQLMDIYTRLLRCVVEHASQRPSETGQFLDDNKLLRHLLEISLHANPKGSLIVALNTLEEQMAVFESRVKFDSIYSDARQLQEPSDGPEAPIDILALPEAKGQRDSSKASQAPKYHVAREHIWNSVKDKEGNPPILPRQARSLVEKVHLELSVLYGLKAALILLPALPKCKLFTSSEEMVPFVDSVGDIGRQLLEKGIVCNHPISQIETSIAAFTAANGGDGCGHQLLKCIQTRLRSKEVVALRRTNVARAVVEAFPVGSRNSEWSVAFEFLGATEYSVACDPAAKLHGTVLLFSQQAQASSAAPAAKEALATIKPEDVKAEGHAAKATAKAAILHAKFTPASSIEMSKVGMRLVAESDTYSVVVESEHKYRDSVSYRGCVVIEGASELSIEFDKRCSTESGCDKLTFFTDDQYKQDGFSSTHDFSGSGDSNWRAFTVKSDRVFYSFSSDSSRNDWGYRFTVKACSDFPLDSEANARLMVASRSIHAALQESSLLKSMQTREWCQVLASVCMEVTGPHRRSFLSCLSRLVATAANFPPGELPDDSCFGDIVKHFVAGFEAHTTGAEPVGTPDLLAQALFLNAWYFRPHAPFLFTLPACL